MDHKMKMEPLDYIGFRTLGVLACHEIASSLEIRTEDSKAGNDPGWTSALAFVFL